MKKIKEFLTSLFGLGPNGGESHTPTFESNGNSDKSEIFSSGIKPLFVKPFSNFDIGMKLAAFSESPNWDWEAFRGVLLCLAMLGKGRYIPANRRPDSISIVGLQQTLAELRQISIQKQGRETSRVVFVNRKRYTLLISGKTRVGTSRNVLIDTTPDPGYDTALFPVLTIHVHPNQPGASGMSDIDYISFLSDPCQIIMMIAYPGGILFTMKTSVTNATIAKETLYRQISVISYDVATMGHSNLSEKILVLNKAICLEFGLTLYLATSPDLA